MEYLTPLEQIYRVLRELDGQGTADQILKRIEMNEWGTLGFEEIKDALDKFPNAFCHKADNLWCLASSKSLDSKQRSDAARGAIIAQLLTPLRPLIDPICVITHKGRKLYDELQYRSMVKREAEQLATAHVSR